MGGVDDDMMPVAAVATWLGVPVQNVRRLIGSGELDGRRLGRDWLVDRRSVLRYRELRPGRGRPLSSRQAWATLLTAEPHTIEDARELAVQCRRRAERQPARVLPGVLGGLLDHDAVVQSGAAIFSAPVGQYRPQAYLRDDDLPQLQEEFRLDLTGAEANVLLRVVPHDDWPFAESDRIVPEVVGLVDLVDEREERWVRDSLAARREGRTP
jgi:hypothetical protein